MCYFSYFHKHKRSERQQQQQQQCGKKARENCLSDCIWHELIFPFGFHAGAEREEENTVAVFTYVHQLSDVCVFDNQNKYIHFAQGAIFFFCRKILTKRIRRSKRRRRKYTGAEQKEAKKKLYALYEN